MDAAAELSQRITQNWFARADRLEDYWRDYAFLGLNEELSFPGGRKIEVRLLPKIKSQKDAPPVIDRKSWIGQNRPQHSRSTHS